MDDKNTTVFHPDPVEIHIANDDAPISEHPYTESIDPMDQMEVEQVDDGNTNDSVTRNRRRLIVIIALSVMLLIAVSIGIGVGVASTNNGSDSSSNSNKPISDPPQLQSQSPSQSQSQSPTHLPLFQLSAAPSPSDFPSYSPSNTPTIPIPQSAFEFPTNEWNRAPTCTNGVLHKYAHALISYWDQGFHHMNLWGCFDAEWFSNESDKQLYVFGGLFQSCRKHYIGNEPANGMPKDPEPFSRLHVVVGQGETDRASCHHEQERCPNGFTEFVVSGTFGSKWYGCTGFDCTTFGPTDKIYTEIVLCLNPSRWYNGHWFGGMYSEIGAKCPRSTDKHAMYGWYGSDDDKVFGNPLNDLQYECPDGYKKHRIAEYCCNLSRYSEPPQPLDDETIIHYVCMRE